VEDGVVIVFVHAELKEIPDCERSFPAPELYFQFSVRCEEYDFRVCWGLFLEDGLHNYKSK
jgi:hypothetical protein